MRTAKYLLISLTLLYMLSSCSSLPFPGTATESLFIMSGNMESRLLNKQSKPYNLISIKMTLVNQETADEIKLTFTPGKKYITLPIEPGLYSMEKEFILNFNDENHSWKETEITNGSYYQIEKNTIFVCPEILDFNRKNIGQGGGYEFSFHRPSSPNLKDLVMERIMEQRRFKAWDLYAVIGWEPPEERDQ